MPDLYPSGRQGNSDGGRYRPIGGDLSHEFIILADTGESEVFCDKKWLDKDLTGKGVDLNDRTGLENWVQGTLKDYAATEEMHDANDAAVTALGDDLVTTRGIEVGHIFHFGTKYSEPMGATVLGPDGTEVPVQMGSYGIGVSRLVGALIEASHDENGHHLARSCRTLQGWPDQSAYGG